MHFSNTTTHLAAPPNQAIKEKLSITASFKQLNFHRSLQGLLKVLNRLGFDYKNGNSVMIKSMLF